MAADKSEKQKNVMDEVGKIVVFSDNRVAQDAGRWPKIARVASAGASKPWQQIQGQVGRWQQSEKPRSSVPPEVAIAAAK